MNGEGDERDLYVSPPVDGTWEQHRLWLVNETIRLARSVDRMANKMQVLSEKVTTLQVKAAVAGGVAGTLMSPLIWLIFQKVFNVHP